MVTRRRRAGWAGAVLLLAGALAGGSAAAEEAPVAPAPAPAAPPAPLPEEPALEGEAKEKYEADLKRYEKRLAGIKANDPLLQFLTELEANGNRAARDFLMKYAKTVKSAPYRERAFEALAKIGGRKATAFLCGKDGARSSAFLVQQQAIQALAKSGDRRAVEPLLEVLEDPALKIENVGAVCITLGKLDPSSPSVEKALFAQSKDKRDTVRANAVEALGYVAAQSEEAFAFLVRCVAEEKNTRVRAAAATGLGWAKRPAAMPALRTAAEEDKALTVKSAAMAALKELGDTGR